MPASLRFRSSLHLLGVVTATLVCCATLTPSASAGTYTVRQCDYTMGISHHEGVWQWAGTVAGGQHSVVPHQGWNCGEFGLALRNNVGGTGVTHANGAYGGFYFYAPNGTYFTRASGMFGTVQGCCVNGMAAYADVTQNQNGSGAVGYLFRGNLPDGSFNVPSGLTGPVGRSWDSSVSGFVGRRFGVFLRCGPGFTCSQFTTGDVRVRGRSFDFTLRDDVTPSLGAPGGTLLSGWARGTRTLSFSAGDTGGGLSNVTATFANGTVLSSPSACPTIGGRYIRLVPCPLTRSGAWNMNTAQLPDGRQTVTVRASDVSGRAAQQTRELWVDNTAPAAPSGATVAGVDGWRSSNGFAIGWSNPRAQHAPIVKAHVRACPVEGGSCVTGERTGEGVASTHVLLPRAGRWEARVLLEDAAGNADSANASPPLRLRFDPDAPRLRFRASTADAPAVVAVDATDVSGIADGDIEVRRQGDSTWTVLPTMVSGTLLSAAIDDSKLPSGLYDVRVHAVDLAGNRATLQGPPLALPTRASTRLEAETVVRARRRARGCPRCRRLMVVRRAPKTRVGRGALVGIDASLVAGSGQALANRPIEIAVSSRDGKRRLVDARTGSDGRVKRLLRIWRSASVLLRFAGDRGFRPSARALAIRVPAPVTIRPSRRSLRPGHSVRFRGRVKGGSIPRRGKLVEVQAHFRGRWRTISTVRSNRTGHWRFAYTFSVRTGFARYGFRARVPSEASYPFEPGTSRPVRVTVRGR